MHHHGGGNCFADNDYSTSAPPSIEQALPCDSPAQGFTADIALLSRIFLTEKPQSADYTTVALPGLPALASMPKAKTARARPATNETQHHGEGRVAGRPHRLLT